jgi:PIN domain nuclease of toxin-antitoxin system
MKLLLDTHVLIWAESLPERLGPEARALLLNPENTLLVSPITTLELSRLIALSRLHLRKSLTDWLTDARKHLFFEDAHFSHHAAIESYELPGDFHKDPADRMLVATARELNCPLLTADELILAYPNVLTIDARK